MPTVLDKQGAQLLAVAVLVLSRTWISDRIASLNGITAFDYACFLINAVTSVITPILIVNV